MVPGKLVHCLLMGGVILAAVGNSLSVFTSYELKLELLVSCIFTRGSD